jgi:NADPH:quinone reductase-like Zn-dependent oxidoreductase
LQHGPDLELSALVYALPMRSAEYDRFGRADLVVVRDRRKPEPRAGEVLVKVRAASLNPKDVLVRSGKFRVLSGSAFPRQLGYDLAGEVCALGRSVRSLREGDAVFGMLNSWGAGTVAEYCAIPEGELWRKPETLSFEDAAALPLTSLTALQGLRDHALLRPGQHVLINGASGGVGVVAIQIAKALGAQVTSVSSAKNRELSLALGSDAWRDYALGDLFAGARYDVIFDVFGNKSFRAVAHALTPRGRYVATVPSLRNILDSVRTLPACRRARLVVVRSNAGDLAQLAGLVDEGRLRAVVHQVYGLDQIVDAQRQLESKHTRGKVVIRMGTESSPG